MSGPTPLRSALKSDDDRLTSPQATENSKAVQIAEAAQEIPPDDEPPSVKQFRANSATRRFGAKPTSSPHPTNSSRTSLSDGNTAQADDEHGNPAGHPLTQYRYHSKRLITQVTEWIEYERVKAARRRQKPRRRKSKSPTVPVEGAEAPNGRALERPRADSTDSQSSEVSLDRLHGILQESLTHLGLTDMPCHTPKVSRSRRRANSRPTLPRAASSDTDYVDGDAVVPDCDAWLDNSKTLAFAAAGASSDDVSEMAARAERDKEAWLIFKNDIIRIAHTLRLKGWRRVELDKGDTITVKRLSGALTNAVYVVTPPADLAKVEGKKPPPKVLLRVYGPQVEHLIDRDNELKVLQRLARKRIGPRLLGTFRNGRFEEFFNALALQPLEIREPDTSKQIAKRMRELHDGIDLLPQERDAGPGVWKNWDQWLDNVAKVVTYLDRQVEVKVDVGRRDSIIHAWRANGHVCGVPWVQFRDTVNKYRKHLHSSYQNVKAVEERLVFAHNDTQYGNILRMRPDDEKSPLLQAANKHKQLIVIDFEYAAANVCGLEFANHFTEWAYNYHDPVMSFACNVERYPSIEEQKRFIKAYVDHRPQFPTASSTPRVRPADAGSSSSSSNANTPAQLTSQSSSSIIDFMLDARAPPGGWGAAEREREERSNQQVRELMDETRLWRPANSVFWVAWGIIQATVPGLDANKEPLPEAEALKAELEVGVGEFDYLSYAQDRALFFWGDIVQMGLVRREDLPEGLRNRIKVIDR
ncbi:hypothetical protein HIM_11256 [Hirsutella minnesotensis 3608]|uniref:Choline kinase N-terminal domain-containing protein n=1 Tax=Hirsutella minnesotensis 3608 TaxID=1043627 RepID=A0A0F7ZJ75_9HYPO|nr:hypothetical protein HIM_11256 [Hirsutella minnesotensis 3608]